MKLKKKDVRRMRELLEEMLAILDTPVPKPEPVDDDPLSVSRLLIDLRAIHMRNASHVSHVNIRAEDRARLLCERSFATFHLGDDDSKYLGLRIHVDEPGRVPWEMW